MTISNLLSPLSNIFQIILRNRLFHSIGVYTVTTAITSFIPFLLIPVLTRFLSTEEYGLVGIFGMLLTFITPFAGLSTYGAVARQYCNRESMQFNVYTGNCFLVMFGSSVVVGIFLFLFKTPLSLISSFPERYLWILLSMAFTQSVVQLFLTVLRVQLKTIQYGIFQINQNLLSAFFTIWFVVGMNLSWVGRIQAQLLASVLIATTGFTILFFKGWIKFSIDKKYIKNAIGFGIPLIPHSLGVVIIALTDRLFIVNYVGLEAIGLYSVGYQIVTILTLFEKPFDLAYLPWIYERLKKWNRHDHAANIRIVKLTYAYFATMLTGVALLTLIAPLFLSFFVGKNFMESNDFILWLALGFAFLGMRKMFGAYIYYMEKTKILSKVTFLSAILNIGLNYVLIKSNGAVGAAQATAITYFVQLILFWKISNKYFPMPWDLKSVDA